MTFSGYIQQIKPTYTIGLYVVIYICLLPLYSYQINPDAVSYIACAQHYTAGEWLKAVNGYWSPLLCWLLVPFINAGIEPLFGIKLLNLCFSGIALFEIYNLAKRYITEPVYIHCLLGICIAHLLTFSLTMATPDIASFALLLLFTQHILKLLDNPASYNIIITAALGALCYFAKYYNFYGILLLSGVTIAYLIFTGKASLTRYILVTVVLFAAISFAWMSIIYLKYGVFVPTTASAFNKTLIYQPYPGYPFLLGNKLFLDYGQFRYTSWEDPFYYPQNSWMVYPSAQVDIARSVKQVLVNLRSMLLSYPGESFLIFLTVWILLTKHRLFRSSLHLLFCMAIVYPAGYMLTIAEQRYIFWSITTLVLLFFAVINTISWKMYKLTATTLLSAAIIGFSAYKMWKMPSGNQYHKAFASLPDLNHADIICSQSAWAETLYICYFKNGKLNDTIRPELIDNTLTNNYPNLKYYACRLNEIPEIMDRRQAIYAGDIVLLPFRKK